MSSGNKIVERFKARKTILKAKMKYFLYDFNNTTDLGKFFSFLKIKKKDIIIHLVTLSCRIVVFQYKFLKHHLKQDMHSG